MTTDAPIAEDLAATTPAFDKQALLARYIAERDKRIRADGNDQYLRVEGTLAHYLDDPYTPFVEREPKTDHVTFAFVGGGFAGLVTGAAAGRGRRQDMSASSRRAATSAAPGTGTAIRAPSATPPRWSTCRCSKRPATGRARSTPTPRKSCSSAGASAEQFGLYDNALFHTVVEDLSWDDANSRWVISTNRGDRFTADYIGLGTGPLHVPKLPGIPGIETFKGHSFHTSRWDYDYTGGDPPARR